METTTKCISLRKCVTSYGFIVYWNVDNKIQFLLLLRKSGIWEPAKGKIEANEGEIKAAYREVEEESGLSENHLQVFLDAKNVIKFLKPNGKEKTIVLWLAMLKNTSTNVRLSSEHVAFDWVDVDEACSLLQYDDFRDVVRNCERHIRENNLY